MSRDIPTGTCPVCAKTTTLNIHGTITAHMTIGVGLCAGSEQPARGPKAKEEQVSNSDTVPMDVTAEQAGAIVKAAIAWRWGQSEESVFTIAEWKLYEATGNYGDRFKGLAAR